MKRYIRSSTETERPIYPSTLREAIKFGFIDKLDLDLYKAEDDRYILYDRYRPNNSAWVSSDGYAYRNFFECWRQDTGWAKKLSAAEMQKYSDEYGIKFQSKSITAATSYDKLKAIAEGIYSFFRETGAETSSTSKIREYLTSKGYDMSDISNADIDEAWDIQASWWDDEDETDGPVVLSNGREIADTSEAYSWLRENTKQYGNTYFWDSSLKNDLNKLIERFGNTYFWRS